MTNFQLSFESHGKRHLDCTSMCKLHWINADVLLQCIIKSRAQEKRWESFSLYHLDDWEYDQHSIPSKQKDKQKCVDKQFVCTAHERWHTVKSKIKLGARRVHLKTETRRVKKIAQIVISVVDWSKIKISIHFLAQLNGQKVSVLLWCSFKHLY